MARSFADDGASGASGGGTAIGPDVVNDFGTPPAPTSTPPSAAPRGNGAGSFDTGQTGFWGNPLGPTIQGGGGGGGSKVGTSSRTGYWGNPIGLSFSGGGAIPDDDDTNGSPQQDQISSALDTVDQVLAFGRKQHGLGGGDNEGIPQQQAMNTEGAGIAGDSPIFNSPPDDGKSMPADWNTPGGGHDYSQFNKSQNIEDRRDGEPPAPQPLGLGAQFMHNAGNRMEELKGTWDRHVTYPNNPLSQDLGQGEFQKQYDALGTGQNAGAINTSDEENQ